MRNVVLAITGASGAIYGVRLLEVLVAMGVDVHVSISPAGRDVLRTELDLNVDLDKFVVSTLLPDERQLTSDSKLFAMRSLAGVSSESSNVLSMAGRKPGKIHYHHYQDMMAPIASGSFLTSGMVVCPCSGGTVSAIAHAASTNLIHRAADVHLKERRKLILVPRETPLSTIQLRNMTLCAEAGAVVAPAMPAFYHGVRSISDLIDFITARICDQLGFENLLIKRWGSE